jgi:hypothetical protein
VVAVDLGSGEGLWKQDLPGDTIEAAGIENGSVWIDNTACGERFA